MPVNVETMDLVSYYVSVFIVLGSAAVKFPQLFRIIKLRSVQNLSLAMVMLDILSLLAVAQTALLNKLSFWDFGEALILLTQNTVILYLYFWYRTPSVAEKTTAKSTRQRITTKNTQKSISSLPRFLQGTRLSTVPKHFVADHSRNPALVWSALLISLTGIVVIPGRILPFTHYSCFLFAIQTAASLCSRIPQLIVNYSRHTTGVLSFTTFFLSSAGSAVRVLTTLVRVALDQGKVVLATQHALSCVLNGLIALQIMWYGGALRRIRERSCNPKVRTPYIGHVRS